MLSKWLPCSVFFCVLSGNSSIRCSYILYMNQEVWALRKNLIPYSEIWFYCQIHKIFLVLFSVRNKTHEYAYIIGACMYLFLSLHIQRTAVMWSRLDKFAVLLGNIYIYNNAVLPETFINSILESKFIKRLHTYLHTYTHAEGYSLQDGNNFITLYPLYWLST